MSKSAEEEKALKWFKENHSIIFEPCHPDFKKAFVKAIVEYAFQHQQDIASKIKDLHDNHGYFQGDNWIVLQRILNISNSHSSQQESYSREDMEESFQAGYSSGVDDHEGKIKVQTFTDWLTNHDKQKQK